MDNFFLYWPDSREIVDFSGYVREFGVQKYSNIRPKSLRMHYNDGIEICYVSRGTYHWDVEGRTFQLYPGDAFVTCPWQWHGSPEEVVDRGILSWLIIKPEKFSDNGDVFMGKWSSLSVDTQRKIGKLLAENQSPVLLKGSMINSLFAQLATEFQLRQFGYKERVHQLLDSLLLYVARVIDERESSSKKDRSFIEKLTKMLLHDLSRKRKVKDLASTFKMSSTAFNNKTKLLTGFSPADYIIELKTNRAKDMLSQSSVSITQIALDCGFYSSQHFSKIFKQRTGKTPKRFRVETKDIKNPPLPNRPL